MGACFGILRVITINSRDIMPEAIADASPIASTCTWSVETLSEDAFSVDSTMSTITPITNGEIRQLSEEYDAA